MSPGLGPVDGRRACGLLPGWRQRRPLPTRKGILKLSREDLAIVASFETERLEPVHIESPRDVTRWHAGADQPVIRERYVKADNDSIAGEPALAEWTVGYRWGNEDGDVVPTEGLPSVQRTPDGDVEEGRKRPTTVKKGEALPVEK